MRPEARREGKNYGLRHFICSWRSVFLIACRGITFRRFGSFSLFWASCCVDSGYLATIR